jgi:undecaprenyl-diphosphatase
MEWWQALVLGLVEGITEYLPISSTGHLILAAAFLGLDGEEVKSSVDAFNIVIQGGAILAVLALYTQRVIRMVKGVFGKDALGRKMAINIVVAFLPAAILGVMLDSTIEKHLFSPIPVLAALFLGGIWMIWIDRSRMRAHKDETHDEAVTEGIGIEELTWRGALAIGLFQVVAMWPGTSRSMMTIAGGTIVGLRPKDAAEFSFLLGLPTLGGACVYKLGKNLMEAHETGQPNLFEQLGVFPVIVGIAVATISAMLAVKWLVAFLTKHGLSAFGYYRIILTLVMGMMILTGIVSF